jgi:hypothetical protein
MHALEAAKLDISETERKVFTPVGITKYWSSAIQVATPYGFSFSGFFRPTFLCLINRILKLGIAAVNFADFIPSLPEAAGEPTAMIRLFNQSNIATTWSWGKYRGNQTYSEAKTLLREVISKINKDPANATAPPIPIVDSDIKAFRGWDYFPRFDKAQLDAGYYDMFNQLQGQQKTYYASGLNGFETVEFAIRAGLDVVESYF